MITISSFDDLKNKREFINRIMDNGVLIEVFDNVNKALKDYSIPIYYKYEYNNIYYIIGMNKDNDCVYFSEMDIPCVNNNQTEKLIDEPKVIYLICCKITRSIVTCFTNEDNAEKYICIHPEYEIIELLTNDGYDFSDIEFKYEAIVSCRRIFSDSLQIEIESYTLCTESECTADNIILDHDTLYIRVSSNSKDDILKNANLILRQLAIFTGIDIYSDFDSLTNDMIYSFNKYVLELHSKYIKKLEEEKRIEEEERKELARLKTKYEK